MQINGALFGNKHKTTDKQPDYRGNAKDQDGNEMEISAWVKQDKNGNPYLSFIIKDAYKKDGLKPSPEFQAHQSAQQGNYGKGNVTYSAGNGNGKDDLPF